MMICNIKDEVYVYHSNNPSVPQLLFFMWMFFSILKTFFTQNVFFIEYHDTQFLFNILFWAFGFLIIAYRLFFVPIRLSFFGVFFGILLFLSILNINVFSFIFNILVWFSISNFISPKSFRKIYGINIFILIVLFYLSVRLNSETLYIDQRYGEVKTFGFENPNGFPQLIIIFFLMMAFGVRWLIVLPVFLFAIFLGEIKTRTFYVILILHPFVVFALNKFKIPKIHWLPLILFFLSLLLVLLYPTGNNLIRMLDEVLSYRISFSSIMLSSISTLRDFFIGNTLSEEILKLPMDFSYIAIIFKYGIIPSIALMFFYYKSLKLMYVLKINPYLPLFVTFLLYSLVENVLVSYTLNPTFYYIFYLLNNHQSADEGRSSL